jgi:hypothetical protein
MKNLSSRIIQSMKPDAIFKVMAVLFISTQLFAIGTVAYLGTFNRYVADDYCESVQLREGSVVSVAYQRYINGSVRSSDRYSNLMFVGLSQMLGKYHNQILPSLMIGLWLIGMIWSTNQYRKLVGVRVPIMLDFLIAISMAFFSIWQAPNSFQTFIWRSGMATHFAPLVFLSLFVGFILSQINSGKKATWWTGFFVILAAFVIGGFSEPPTTFMIFVISLLILYALRWDNVEKRRATLTLLIYSLIGFLAAFLTMFLSPGNVSHGTASLTALPVAFVKTIRFTYNFLDDTIRTLPLPTLISIFTSFIIAFVFYSISENRSLSTHQKKLISMWLIAAPVVQFLLIASSFAPSAFAQSYPAERAQFLGRLIMTSTLLLEGALLGVLFAHSKLLFSSRRLMIFFGSLAFFVLAFYPMRAGLTILSDAPEYRESALAWDLREEEIHESIALGERDLVVIFLPTKEGIKEIDATTKHWVNRCAAQYYEVDSIRSVQAGS